MLSKVNFLILVILIIISFNLLGQNFTEIDAYLTNVYLGTSIWGDYDNDGDLDLFISGWAAQGGIQMAPFSKLYRNDGNNQFMGVVTPIINVGVSSAAWGDYDNDGDLDLIVMGNAGSNNYITKLYKNNGNDNFSIVNTNIINLYNGNLAWGDYNNDGKLDLVISGENSSGTYTKIYKNNGNDNFEDINANIIQVAYSSVTWIDYDKDNDLDLFITGREGSNTYKAKLYRNDNGNFVDSGMWFKGVRYCSSEAGDFDNDGDLDLLYIGQVHGDSIPSVYTKLYRNDNGIFNDTYTNLPPLNYGRATFGDYDNDGLLDILLHGALTTTGVPFISHVYKNLGNEDFAPTDTLPGASRRGYAAWGDYDNDNDLDLITIGWLNSGSYQTKLYRNNSLIPNINPPAPIQLNAVVNNGEVTFSWQVPQTDATHNSLTYNIRVGTSSNSSDIVCPPANLSNGYLKIPQIGNTQTNKTWKLKNLNPGKYYWSVQAVDNSFGGSQFATEQSFVVKLNAPILLSPDNNAENISLSNINFSWQPVNFADKYEINISINNNFSGNYISFITTNTNFTLSSTNLLHNTIYYWRVKAIDNELAEINSDWSEVRQFRTKTILPPVLIAPANNSQEVSTLPEFKWRRINENPKSTLYNLKVYNNANNSCLIDILTSDTLFNASTPLSPVTTYKWHVCAIVSGVFTQYSDYYIFTTAHLPSSAPTLAYPPNNATDLPFDINFAWNSVNYATKYNLQISTNQNFSSYFLNNSNITNTSFQVTGLANNTTYFWRVRAISPAGESDWSEVRKFTTINTTPPSIPILISPANNANNINNNVTLLWHPAANSNCYNLQVSLNQDFTNLIVNQQNVADTLYQLNGLLNGNRYYWRVSGRNGSGSGQWSDIFCFTVHLPAPILLAHANGDTVTNTQNPRLVWSSVSNASSYQVYVSTNSNFTTFLSFTTSDTTLPVPIPAKDITRYYWKVKALTLYAESNWSSTGNYYLQFVSVDNYSSISYKLYQNIPNPFNPTTLIKFEIPTNEYVTLNIYDINGKIVKKLVDSYKNAGSYEIKWDGKDDNGNTLATGIYFYTLKSGSYISTKKMILIK